MHSNNRASIAEGVKEIIVSDSIHIFEVKKVKKIESFSLIEQKKKKIILIPLSSSS